MSFFQLGSTLSGIMKKIIIALLMLTGSTIFAQKGWITDYDTALEKAQKTQLPVLLIFSGSDWCPPCMFFEKRILSQSVISDACNEIFVPLYIDLPEKKFILPEKLEVNKNLAKKFGVGTFPTIILLNSEGKILSKDSGLPWRQPQEFLDWITENIKKSDAKK